MTHRASSTPGTSTLAQRDAAARAIAERVVAWHRRAGGAKTARERQAELEQLGRDLERLAETYVERKRTHEGLSVDALAVADGPTLLERVDVAPFDSPQRNRAEAAAVRFLTSARQRVRVGAEGRPVVLRAIHPGRGIGLYGSQDGRAEYVGIRESLRAPCAEAFEPFVGPEQPPDTNRAHRCYCKERHALSDCPDAKPCEGKCGRLTFAGYACRFCANRRWEAAAWLVAMGTA